MGYHGTDAEFDKFDPAKMGTRTDPGFFGMGAYFVDDKGNAAKWGSRVVTAEIHLKNPLVVSGMSDFIKQSGQRELPKNLSQEEHKKAYAKEMKRVTEDLIARGHDGVVYKRTDGKVQYISFHPDKHVKVISSVKNAARKRKTKKS